jgi:hypothetical protein
MGERRCKNMRTGGMALLVVVLLWVSSPAQAGWKNLSVPAVSSDWTLNGVYGVSKVEAWAVGSDFENGQGVLLHFINGAWSSVTPPEVSAHWELFDVNFTSVSEGWAVGQDFTSQTGVLLHYQNGTWVSVTPPTVSSSWFLTSVHFTSAAEGWAVGVDDSIQVATQGALLHFQNSSWTKVSPPAVLPTWVLNDVFLTTPQSGWAVGTGVQVQKKGILLQWQNGNWNPFLAPSVADIWELVGVNFTSSDEGWAVGNNLSFLVTTGLLLHFFNNSWTPVSFSFADPNLSWSLSGVFFPVSSEGWAVGSAAPGSTEEIGLLIHFLNGSWLSVSPPNISPQWGLSNVHFPAADTGWAVGRDEFNRKGVSLGFGRKPEITVTPLALNFKNVPAGTLAHQKVTVRNDGFSALTLGTVSTPADPFTRVGGTCEDGQVLPPDQGCSIKIGFQPLMPGAFKSDFEISSNDANESIVTVKVKGRSGDADLTGEWISLSQSCRSTDSGDVCKLNGSLKVRNEGFKYVATASVRYFLSDDGVYDTGDLFLKKYGTGELPIGTGKKFAFNYKFPVGETASGKYVIAVLDLNDKIVEIDETNNEIVFGPIP